jgi:hypothetical protein
MSRDDRDYKLDISSLPAEPKTDSPAQDESPSMVGRPWLSVHFACCGVYQRVYRSADGTHYQGHCPRCGGRVRFVVAEGGTTSRSFRVS